MDVNYTQEQRSAIYSRGGSILVGAAAGSGKTTVLSERIVSMLADQSTQLDASRILVLTFSNAAASDMKQKIKKKLNEAVIKEPGNLHLRKQQKLLKRARISTIHSFCAQILREYFSTLGIAPDFSIAEDGFTESIKQRALEKAMEQSYELFPERMKELVNNFGRARSDREASEAILNLYEFEQTLAWPDRWESMVLNEIESSIAVQDTGWGKEAKKQALELMGEALRISESNLKIASETVPDAGSYLEKLQNEIEFIKRLIRALDSWNYNLIISILSEKRETVRTPAKMESEIKELIKVRRGHISKMIKKISSQSIFSFTSDKAEELQEKQYPLVKTLFEAKKLYSEALMGLKDERNFFEYNDLESYTLRLLYDDNGSRSEVAEAISSCYDQIFVDEFQDTNERQKAIFDAISKDGNNLFYVGDVKQSIYSFRRADPSIFMRVRDEYETSKDQFPQYISLQHNFRSSKQVVDSVNNIFDPLMTKKFGGVDYVKGDRLKKEENAESIEYGDQIGMDFSLILGDGDDEAKYIASKINQMLTQQYLIMDDEIKKFRPCRPEDFCILLRTSKNNYERFQKALEKMNIPCIAPGNDNFFESSEIRTIISLLKVVDNPRRDVDVAAVLLSPIGGYDVDELVKLRLIDRKKKLWQLLLERHSSKDTVFVDFIRGLRQKATRLSVEEFVGAAITDSNAEVLLTAPPESQRRKERLFALIDYASTFMSYGGRDLRDFLRFCDAASEHERGPIMGRGDAYGVTITTVHKAKGLEWPIVFIADVGHRFNLSDSFSSGVLYDSACGVGMKLRMENEQGTYNETSPSYRTISQKKTIESKAEEMRILYVALTRAKQKDFITATVSDDKDDPGFIILNKRRDDLIEGEILPGIASSSMNWLSWILMSFCSNGFCGPDKDNETEVKGSMSLSFVNQTVEDEEVIVEETEYDTTETIEAINDRIWASYPYSEATALPTKITVTQMVHGPTFRKVVLSRPSFVRGGHLTAAEQGTAVHRFMEVCDLKAAADDPAKEIERLKNNNFLDVDEADSISVSAISTFFNSELGKKVIESENILREYAFLDTITAEEYKEGLWNSRDEKILIQGVADCVLVGQKSGVLIDFKTDRLEEATDYITRYSKQLYYYRNSLEKILGIPISECYLWSFYLGKAIPVVFGQ